MQPFGLHITTNIILILVHGMLIWNAVTGDVPCIPGRWREEQAHIKVMKTWVSGVSKTAKYIPLILAIVKLDTIRDFFVEVGETGCGDDVTNRVLQFLGDDLSSAYWDNIQAIVVDSVQLLIIIILATKDGCCGDKGGDGDGDGDGGTGKGKEENV